MCKCEFEPIKSRIIVITKIYSSSYKKEENPVCYLKEILNNIIHKKRYMLKINIENAIYRFSLKNVAEKNPV